MLTQGVKLAGRLHRLSEEVGKVIGGADERHLEFERLDHVTDEEMAALHMLHAVMVFRIIGDVTRPGVPSHGVVSYLTSTDIVQLFGCVFDSRSVAPR